MLSETAKTLLVIEIVVCFVPIASLWAVGFLLLPGWISSVMTEPDLILDVEYFLSIPGPVIGGALGLIALYNVTKRILDASSKAIHPTVALVFILIGVIAAAPVAIFDAFRPFRYLAIVPLIVTLHTMYLGRNYLLGRQAH